MVPKTGSGRFDPERGERAAVLQVVERAHLLAQHGYAVSWQQYNKPEDGGAAQRDGREARETVVLQAEHVELRERGDRRDASSLSSRQYCFVLHETV